MLLDAILSKTTQPKLTDESYVVFAVGWIREHGLDSRPHSVNEDLGQSQAHRRQNDRTQKRAAKRTGTVHFRQKVFMNFYLCDSSKSAKTHLNFPRQAVQSIVRFDNFWSMVIIVIVLKGEKLNVYFLSSNKASWLRLKTFSLKLDWSLWQRREETDNEF